MTILFLARRFYPEIGGVEKHVLEIGKRLVKKGHKVVVIAENPQKTHSGSKQSTSKSARMAGKVDGIEIYRINAGNNDWFKKFRIWRELWKYIRLISDADIVHCHDVFFWYLPFRFLFLEKRVYTTFHGYEGNSIPTKRAILMHKLSEKLSRGNICVGDFLAKWYGTKPTVVIYGAVDRQMIDQGSKPLVTSPSKDAMFLGRLEEETGIMEYLKALRILKRKGVNLSLDVFGDGALRNEAKKYALDNQLKVSFKGFVVNAPDFIKDYQYVFVSRYLGILEVMALKKPVFAQYNNSIKKDYLEMAPFSAWISISKDEEEIAANIQNVISGKSKLDIDKAYLWVKDKTWENLTSLYLKLWK